MKVTEMVWGEDTPAGRAGRAGARRRASRTESSMRALPEDRESEEEEMTPLEVTVMEATQVRPGRLASSRGWFQAA